MLDASNKALKTAVPEIMNSDQGSHFTSPKYTKIFISAGSKISMDHRGRAYDNIFIEMFWRTIKYEDIYLNEYNAPLDARIGIARYIHFYNTERPHSCLRYHTPESVYYSVT